MGPYLDFAAARAQITALMPVSVTLHDPVQGIDFAVSKQDMLDALTIDIATLGYQAQVLAALYAEMSRAQRAAEFAAAKADASYRRWKSAKMRECREADGAKKPTIAQQEAYYREDGDYEAMALEPERLKAIAGLFDDLKRAVRLKSDVMRNVVDNVRSAQRVET